MKQSNPERTFLQVDIHIENRQKCLSLVESSLSRIIEEVLFFKDVQTDALSLYLVETSEICELHEQFFDDPTTTDCISFPMDAPGDLSLEGEQHVLGEVFVCPETACDYVSKNGGEASREVVLYIVHGLLHLLGYDDIEDRDRLLMRQAEKEVMDHLDQMNLLLDLQARDV